MYIQANLTILILIFDLLLTSILIGSHQKSQQSAKMIKNKSPDAMSSYTKVVKMLYFKHVGSIPETYATMMIVEYTL